MCEFCVKMSCTQRGKLVHVFLCLSPSPPQPNLFFNAAKLGPSRITTHTQPKQTMRRRSCAKTYPDISSGESTPPEGTSLGNLFLRVLLRLLWGWLVWRHADGCV